jgi:hypothetical protein
LPAKSWITTSTSHCPTAHCRGEDEDLADDLLAGDRVDLQGPSGRKPAGRGIGVGFAGDGVGVTREVFVGAGVAEMIGVGVTTAGAQLASTIARGSASRAPSVFLMRPLDRAAA